MISYTVRELALITGADLVGDPEIVIKGVDSLETAEASEASFLANDLYEDAARRSQAGVIFVSPSFKRDPNRNYLIHEDPSLSFQTVIRLFLDHPYQDSGFLGIHPTAVIHPTAKVDPTASIGPYVVIDQGASIGKNSKIHAHVSIGPGVKVGEWCEIYSHATIRELCTIGNRVTIQPNAVIGSCGFGFSTNSQGVHTKLDQLGIVEIEDDVEVGAGTTIDRARFKKTKISKGTKIDNLVQIGHNVQIGPHNLIVSQTGIAGSSSTGRHVILGGQCGVVGHIHICDGVMVGAKGGISKNITTPGKYAGVPVQPLAQHNREQVYLRKISKYIKKIEEIEKKLLQNS